MPPGAPARLALALGLGLWLGGLASPGRGCGPCAPPCLCGPAPGAACRVNCSGRGLRTLGPALRIPADTTALSLDVWIGFSAVEGPEAGLAPQGEAFNLESCQNWLPGEPHPATAEHCVRLGPEGQCNTDLCSAPHSYVCELRPGGPVWDAENFLMGVPDGGLQGPLILLTPQEGLMPPRHPVEVMVFSGLSPNRESFLTTAEFETQELEEPAQLRLQVQPSGGAGTTAHVGIMLYGADSRSGHRHLDGDRAFHRNSLDIFRIATPHSLGNVWKIRVWHDNKGLSPAWFLQHIIVRDLQSARSTFFLVNDWLSVETEANGGLVEKEVLAASDAALWQFQRLLVAELQCGFFDKHIWLSLWDRPARSRFTRVQRATCCVLLICLFLGANAVWYGVVGDATYSVGPVSHLISSSVDTVAIGLVSSVAVCPVYLAILFLFRMSRSKQVAGGPNPSPTRQRALELDSCLDSSILDSSFLTFSGLRTEKMKLRPSREIPPCSSGPDE